MQLNFWTGSKNLYRHKTFWTCRRTIEKTHFWSNPKQNCLGPFEHGQALHIIKKPFNFIEPDNGDRPDGGGICSSGFEWIYKLPQGFSCGVGADLPGSIFDEYVTVDCSEIVVKMAKARNCNNHPEFGDDCFNYVNWT